MRNSTQIIFIALLSLLFVEGNTQSANELFEEAKTYSENGKCKKAINLLEQAIDKDAYKSKYYYHLGKCLEEAGRHIEALDVYDKALYLINDSDTLFNARANLLVQFQENDRAISDYTAALNLATEDSMKVMYLSNRSIAKSHKRDFNAAYADLLKAYELDSTDLAVLTNLGAVCDEIGNGHETIKYLEKALEQDSMFYPAYANIGFKYQEMGNYEKAIEYYDKVLHHNPNEPLGYSNRAFNLYKLGNVKDALSDINTSLKLYPTNSYALKVRALIYIEMGKTDKACEDLMHALDLGYTERFGNEVEELFDKHCK